ncbi:MAG: M13 family peptidase, partial [Burkholderiales bacterium]|nr:M13 family peptidase [Burkholderiales bacterium]
MNAFVNPFESTPRARLRKLLSAALLATSLAAPFTPVHAESAAALASGIDRSAFDPAVRAQDDLYRHVNGRWLAHATFPPDKAYIGVTEQLYDRTQDELRDLIEAASRRTGDPEAAQIGDLYASFMDEAAADRIGLDPIRADLGHIAAITDKAGLVRALGALQKVGVEGTLGAGVDTDAKRSDRYIVYFNQGGIGLPDESY